MGEASGAGPVGRGGAECDTGAGAWCDTGAGAWCDTGAATGWDGGGGGGGGGGGDVTTGAGGGEGARATDAGWAWARGRLGRLAWRRWRRWWAGRRWRGAAGADSRAGRAGARARSNTGAAAFAAGACATKATGGGRTDTGSEPPRCSTAATRMRDGARGDAGGGQPSGHCAGHRSARMEPGGRQRSRRAGALPARITKRVYLPIRVRPITKTSITAPELTLRSRPRRRTACDADRTCRFRRRALQPGPWQRARTIAPFGARTDSTWMRAIAPTMRPRIRTTGNGLMSSGAIAGAGVTPGGAAGGGGAGRVTARAAGPATGSGPAGAAGPATGRGPARRSNNVRSDRGRRDAPVVGRAQADRARPG